MAKAIKNQRDSTAADRDLPAQRLSGSWVGSFLPLKFSAVSPPPAAYGTGCQPASVMLCFRFANDYTFFGEARRNLNQPYLQIEPMSGTFTVKHNVTFDWIEGEIHIIKANITTELRYVLIDNDEMNIILNNRLTAGVKAPGNMGSGVWRRVRPA